MDLGELQLEAGMAGLWTRYLLYECGCQKLPKSLALACC